MTTIKRLQEENRKLSSSLTAATERDSAFSDEEQSAQQYFPKFLVIERLTEYPTIKFIIKVETMLLYLCLLVLEDGISF